MPRRAGDMECWGSWKTSRTEAGSDYKSGLGLPRQLQITRGTQSAREAPDDKCSL